MERLLNVIVLTSLPVSLYGVLQHYGLDPLPWAGNVVERVTANLGNAIFIAAYLIMAFFITVERVVARFRRLLGEEGGSLADAFMGGGYLFILALQLMAIYFSKSRGPWLGLLGGAYVFALIVLVALRRSEADQRPLSWAEVGRAGAFAVLSPLVLVAPAYLAFILTRRGRRWLWLSWCLQSLLILVFLVVFNLPQSPLAPLRRVPGLGRLGEVFETESGTGRVRVLIWEGAVEMIQANPLRTLVGYGPESMYVAYNPFYPPDLAHYEARNASPDRSHNETFDALIMTGVLGFLVYIWLFVAIFLHGLRWLGFLPKQGPSRQERLFLGLTVGGAALGAVVPLVVDGSLRFAGVGIPAGLISGVAVSLAISAFTRHPAAAAPSFGQRELLLTGLLAMIVAHFVEIHFGIAIAATRVYFWLGLALLISATSGHLSLEPLAATPPAARAAPVPLSGRKRKRRRHQAQAAAAAPLERTPALQSGAAAAGFIGALILGTVLFDFITNTSGDTNVVRVVWAALTSIRPLNQPAHPSLGAMGLLLLTWLAGASLVITEAENAERAPDGDDWLAALGLYFAISLPVALTFALAHATQLRTPGTPGGGDLGLTIYGYYAFALGMVLLAAAFLPRRHLLGLPLWRRSWAWSYPVLAVVVGLMVLANASVVRADIYYKQAWDGYHRRAFEGASARTMDLPLVQAYYRAAIERYAQALRYAPDEDYYLLFLGKAYLELAEMTEKPEDQQALLRSGEEALRRARDLNPLNTDHTANLARLYRTWAGVTSDPAARQEKLAQAVEYYVKAIELSPHSAGLYNEWGRSLLDSGRAEEGLAAYQRSLALDDRFAQTYLHLGDYYLSRQELAQAAQHYERAAAIEPRSAQVLSTLGYVYSRLGRYTEAISANVRVLELYPQDYATHKNLAILYHEVKQYAQALAEATRARELGPQSDRAALDEFIAQVQAALRSETKP